MFFEDNGFRDMFIYGSAAVLAALAMPSTRAHAAEIYLCGDGRILELTNATRTAGMADTCVVSWYSERRKAIAPSQSVLAQSSVAQSHMTQTNLARATSNQSDAAVPSDPAIPLAAGVHSPVKVSSGHGMVERTSGYQIQTAAIALINAEEVPEKAPVTIAARRAGDAVHGHDQAHDNQAHDKPASDKRAQRGETRRRSVKMAWSFSPRDSHGLRYMGSGIYAE